MQKRRTLLSPVLTNVQQREVRDYLFDMIQELEKMARDADEVETAIHLAAILEAARAGGRR